MSSGIINDVCARVTYRLRSMVKIVPPYYSLTSMSLTDGARMMNARANAFTCSSDILQNEGFFWWTNVPVTIALNQYN